MGGGYGGTLFGETRNQPKCMGMIRGRIRLWPKKKVEVKRTIYGRGHHYVGKEVVVVQNAMQSKALVKGKCMKVTVGVMGGYGRD